MKLYNLDITISNEHGELLDVRKKFTSLDELNQFITNSTEMHKLWCEAEDNGKKDGMLYEELFDNKEEMEFNKIDDTEQYQENN